MSDAPERNPLDDADRDKALRKLERKLQRAEEQLRNYERLVDRTQHLLNTRIQELETARAALAERGRALEESEKRQQQLADAAFEAILIHEGATILDCNDAAAELYGHTRETLIGGSMLDLVPPGYQDVVRERLYDPSASPMELQHLRIDGTALPVEVRSRGLTYYGREAAVTVVRDISSHKAMQARLTRLANTDQLTGIGNRRYFMESAGREFSRALRYHHTLALVMIDIDRFKRINDTQGHEVGDRAIQAVTAMCCEGLRDSDVFGRIGGEEFAALLPHCDLDSAHLLAERLRKRAEAHRVDTHRGTLRFTLSLGITELHTGDEDVETLLNRADRALYIAKDSGRNRVVASPDASDPVV